MLSRPWADDDEKFEDERLVREWARDRYGNGTDYDYDDSAVEDGIDEYDDALD